jgi:hypothetical protein
MSIERLKSIVPPPQNPVETGSPDAWAEVERGLGTELPQDYKDFINAYGTGVFRGTLVVYNPFSSKDSCNLLKGVKEDLEIYRQSREEFPEFEPPYPAYPEAGGLLPWGRDDVGNTFFWHTGQPLTDWAVVLYAHEGWYERLLLSMTEVLARFFEGHLETSILSADRRGNEIYFKPININSILKQ